MDWQVFSNFPWQQTLAALTAGYRICRSGFCEGDEAEINFAIEADPLTLWIDQILVMSSSEDS